MAFSYILSCVPFSLPTVAAPYPHWNPPTPAPFLAHVLKWECAEVKELERHSWEDKNRKGNRTHVTCKNFRKVALDERLANGILAEGSPIVWPFHSCSLEVQFRETLKRNPRLLPGTYYHRYLSLLGGKQVKRSPRVDALGRLVLVYLSTDWEKLASSAAGC